MLYIFANPCIVSFSNPLTYAICLDELGQELVHKYQGKEPSGRMFNEIALDHQSTHYHITVKYKFEFGEMCEHKLNLYLHIYAHIYSDNINCAYFHYRQTTQSIGEFWCHHVSCTGIEIAEIIWLWQ